jgi:hypothetical protein
MPAAAKTRRAIRAAAAELLYMMIGVLFVRREIWQLHVFDVSMPYWQEGMLLPLAAIDGAITGAHISWRRNVEHLPAYRGALRWGTPVFFILYIACGALCERLNFGLLPKAAEIFRWLGLAMVVGGVSFRLWAQSSSPSELDVETPPAVAPGAESTEVAPTEVAPTEVAPTEVARAQEVPPPSATTVPELVDKFNATTNKPAESPAAALLGDGLFPSGPHKWLRYPDFTGRLIALCGIPLCFNAWLPLLAVPGIITLLKWHISDQEAFRISQLGERYLEYRKKTWYVVPYIY